MYCESLEVAEDVEGATLQVDGNLWTMDDIQMTGNGRPSGSAGQKRKTVKTVAKYSYIGLNGESSLRDPNTSSSVINNFPFNTTGGITALSGSPATSSCREWLLQLLRQP